MARTTRPGKNNFGYTVGGGLGDAAKRRKAATARQTVDQFPVHSLMAELRSSASATDSRALRETRIRVLKALSTASIDSDVQTTFAKIISAEREAAEQLTGNARKRTLVALKTLERVASRQKAPVVA